MIVIIHLYSTNSMWHVQMCITINIHEIEPKALWRSVSKTNWSQELCNTALPWWLRLKRKFRYKRSVARPLTASVVNQPPSRADLVVRAGSYLLFRGNRCFKFSSTGTQNYTMSWQTQVNTKWKFSTLYSFSKFQTQTCNNILRLNGCLTFSLIPPDYFKNRWRTEMERVSCIH